MSVFWWKVVPLCFSSQLNGEGKEGNGCRSTRNLKIVKWPVWSGSSVCSGNGFWFYCLKVEYLLQGEIRTHGFDSHVSSRAVILDPVGYLSAVSGPSQSPDSHLSYCRGSDSFPNWALKRGHVTPMWTPHTRSNMIGGSLMRLRRKELTTHKWPIVQSCSCSCFPPA